MILTDTLFLIILIGAAVLLGILGGCGAVWVLNHLPPAWLTDYGEQPTQELLEPGRQRISGYPWKYVFSALFCAAYLWLFTSDYTTARIYLYTGRISYALAAAIAVWLLLLVGLSDRKYRIIPDQLVLALAITAVGFLSARRGSLAETVLFRTFSSDTVYSWSVPADMLAGALLGGGALLLTGLLGKLMFHREAMGFGDVKLMTAVGLIAGLWGTALILIGVSFLSCIVYGIQLLRRKISRGDTQPLGDLIAVIAAAYLLLSV